MKRSVFLLISFLPLFFSACKKDASDLGTRVERLDLVLSDFADLDSAAKVDVIDRLHADLSAMMAVAGAEVSVDGLDVWASSRVVEVFQPAVDSVFPPSYDFGKIVGSILYRAEKNDLILPDMDFATVTWGSTRRIVKVDSVVLIALNHYLGADYPGYSAWPAYIRANKRPEALPYDLASVIAATSFPFVEGDVPPTLLQWMLYEGALIECKMRLVPDADLALALGYDKSQLDFAKRNLPKVWEEMMARKMVYETDPLVIDRLITPSVSSPLIDGKAPGQIVRFVGYSIVRSYLDRHPDTKLSFILSKDFYASPQSLVESGFTAR